MRRPRPPQVALLLIAFILGATFILQSQDRDPGPGAVVISEFTTPDREVPLNNSSILVLGDSGSGDQNQQAVANAIVSTTGGGDIAALVMTGDNVYPNGSPNLFRTVLDKPYRSWLGNAPIIATMGNHDVQDGYGDAQLKHLGLPTLPYRKTVGDIEFFVLDANHPDSTQSAWLDEALTNSSARFTVAVFHQPAYSCSTHGSTAEVQQYFVPLLEAHQVTLALSGHDHNYQRFKSGVGVTYLVTGGGGAKLYPTYPCPESSPPRRAAVSAHHFLTLTANEAGLDLNAISVDGQELDHVLLTSSTLPASR